MKALFPMLLILSLSAFAKKTTKFSVSGQIINYAKIDMTKVIGEVYWSRQNWSKVWNKPSNFKSGTHSFKVNPDGSFNTGIFKVKRGKYTEAMLLRFKLQKDDAIIPLSNLALPYNQELINQQFQSVSVYKFENEPLTYQFKDQTDALDWIQSTGRETRVEYKFDLLDATNKDDYNAIFYRFQSDDSTSLKATYTSAPGDLGANPKVNLVIKARNAVVSKSGIIYEQTFENLRLTFPLSENLRIITLNVDESDPAPDRSIDGKYRIGFHLKDVDKYTWVHGDLTVKCIEGTVQGEASLIRYAKNKPIFVSFPASGQCQNEVAKIQFPVKFDDFDNVLTFDVREIEYSGMSYLSKAIVVAEVLDNEGRVYLENKKFNSTN